MKLRLLASVFFLATASAHAGGYSGWAVPTIVEYSNEGLLVYGNFNDVNNCSPGTNQPVFVAEDPNNPDFLKTVGPMLMMAVQAQSEVQFYLQSCTTVSWRQGSNAVFNRAWTSGVLFNSSTNPVGVSPDNLITRVETLEQSLSETAQKTEIQVTTNMPTSIDVWRPVTYDTQISYTRLCGANGGQYTYVYLREDVSNNEMLVEQARCWEYNTDTATFMVPAGWEYKYTLYAPESAVAYTFVPVAGN